MRASRDIRIIDPVEHPSWDAQIQSIPGGTFFHSSVWARVLAGSYGFKPLYFSIFDEDRLVAVVPLMEVNSFLTGRRGVSLPFSDYAGPIAAPGVDPDGLIGEVLRHAEGAGWKYVELRCRDGKRFKMPPSERHIGHTLELLPDTTRTAARFSDANRRNIRRAERLGVRVEISGSAEAVREFYGLNCLTRKRHGLPPQPYYFFKAVHEHVIARGLGIAALATYDGKTISGAIYFRFGNDAIYKYGASEKAYQHTRANNLVMWEAIRHFSKLGATSLCFGRTEPENTGLRRFKSGWGAEESVINYYRYDLAKKAFIQGGHTLSGAHNKLFKNMPMPLLRLLGTVLYKHIG